jgi:hypothetical protein
MSSRFQIEENIVDTYIKTAFESFENDDFDFKTSKKVMAEYITKYCKTKSIPEPPSDPDAYALNIVSCDAFVMYVKDCVKVLYFFHIPSGHLGVGELKDEVYHPGIKSFRSIVQYSPDLSLGEIMFMTKNGFMCPFVNNND